MFLDKEIESQSDKDMKELRLNFNGKRPNHIAGDYAGVPVYTRVELSLVILRKECFVKIQSCIVSKGLKYITTEKIKKLSMKRWDRNKIESSNVCKDEYRMLSGRNINTPTIYKYLNPE